MKVFFFLSALSITVLSASDCSSKKTDNTKYKARLEIKGICFNYTIQLLDGTIDTSKIVADWTDETNGKSYSKVFGLANPCSFPSSINQGDEFYFIIDTAKPKDCMVCEAYYPTPPRSLNIKVVDN